MKIIYFFLGTFLIPCLLSSQTTDPVLFTVANTPVTKSEFTYIYSKTNGAKADFSKKSVEDYLELYKNFKLKVAKAKDLQLDTIPSLKKELDGYRRQLSDSYLTDKEVTDRLVREAFERSKKDIEISHIMVSIPKNPAPDDTLSSFNKITEASARLKKGESFEKVAAEMSDDKSASSNGGRIGYYTALLPEGFYALENAMYNQKIGDISPTPIRSGMGYHLLRVNDERPARGEIEVAHILIRKAEGDGPKMRIDSIHSAIKNGGSFDDLAKALSQDSYSSPKNGYIGFVSINRFEPIFENMAFGLQEDNDITVPFQTSIGWHIIKRISKKVPLGLEASRRSLEAKVKRDPRFELSKSSMLARLKSEYGYKVSKEVLKKMTDTLTASFFSHRWLGPDPKPNDPLFELAGKSKTLGDFVDYCKSNLRKRLTLTSQDPAVAAMSLFDDYVNETTLQIEETKLAVKYPEFKHLLREYEEGILLFEATRLNVWDKASQDSIGLAKFYETLKGKYKWEDRIITSTFTVKPEASSEIESIRKLASRKGGTSVVKKFNKKSELVTFTGSNPIEKSKLTNQNLEWKVGYISQNDINASDKSISFTRVDKIIPSGNKTLKEARGYVIADYQDYLEKAWLKDLSSKYKIDVNQSVLNSLIK
jgi:peptidyl-prolyl cis-trans isomerase SurA